MRAMSFSNILLPTAIAILLYLALLSVSTDTLAEEGNPKKSKWWNEQLEMLHSVP